MPITDNPTARAKIIADLVQNFDSEKHSIRELLSNREGPIRVLEIGCGDAGAYTVGALDQYFGPENYTYLGVDNNETHITYATALFADDARTKVHFKCLDATKPDNLPDLEPGSIDLVILRHPNIMEQTKTFEEIFCEFVPTFLKSDGVLFISTFFEEEMDKLRSQRFMTSFGLESFPAEKQQRVSPIVRLPFTGAEMDKFVAFGRVSLSERLEGLQRKALHDYLIAPFLAPEQAAAAENAGAGQVPEAAPVTIPAPSASWLSQLPRDRGFEGRTPAKNDYGKAYRNPSSSR